MGTWQLGKFEDRVDSHQEAEQRPAASSLKAAPLATLLPVDKETSGRSAEARGRLGSSSWCRSASWTAGPVRTS
ncbi:SURF1 family cytochrome oxidase biogenesis protein [Streptomyces narbonensis]